MDETSILQVCSADMKRLGLSGKTHGPRMPISKCFDLELEKITGNRA